MALQINAARLEERPHKPSPSKTDARDPAGSGASKEPQENGLRLIIFRVPGRYQIGAELVRAFIEALVSRVARRHLNRDAPVTCQTRDVPTAHFDRKAEALGEGPAKDFVRVGLGSSESVIDVNQSGE